MDTPISLPPDLIIKIECEASARGMSLADFVRISLERALAENPDDDPLFADAAIYGEGGAADFAANHDEYLYGDASCFSLTRALFWPVTSSVINIIRS